MSIPWKGCSEIPESYNHYFKPGESLSAAKSCAARIFLAAPSFSALGKGRYFKDSLAKRWQFLFLQRAAVVMWGGILESRKQPCNITIAALSLVWVGGWRNTPEPPSLTWALHHVQKTRFILSSEYFLKRAPSLCASTFSSTNHLGPCNCLVRACWELLSWC